MTRRLAIYLFLTALLAGFAGQAAEPAALRFDAFPTEAYRAEEATFLIRGDIGKSLTVTLNDKTIAETTFTSSVLELSLPLSDDGALVFSSGDANYKFRLVSPSTAVTFTERDGFLYVDDQPAILLPDHRHPPKHDRTWEGWKLIKSLVITPEERRIASQLRLNESASAFYELHGRILALPKAAKKDLILLCVSPQDLKRGVSELSFRMRLEWILQKLEPQKGKQLMLLMIYDDMASWKQYKYVNHSAKLASRSSAAAFVTLRLNPGDHASSDHTNARITAVLDDMFSLQPEVKN